MQSDRRSKRTGPQSCWRARTGGIREIRFVAWLGKWQLIEWLPFVDRVLLGSDPRGFRATVTFEKSSLGKTEVAVTGNHMPEPTTPRSTSPKRHDQPSGVSAVVLAQHLDCSGHICLEGQGVLHRGPNGNFPLDASRVAYIRHLRRQRQQSAKSAADVAFQEAKTRLLQLRIGEREKVLMMTDEAIETVQTMIGCFGRT
jgi:hypothetical protein